MALFVSPNSVTVLSAVPVNRRGISSGTVATERNMGMVIGVALAGLIFNGKFQSFNGEVGLKVYPSDLEPIFIAAFRHAMQAGAVVAGIGAVVALFRGSEENKSFVRRS